MSAIKKNGIPLSELFRDSETFRRNYKKLLAENRPADAKLRDALADELSSAAARGVKFPSGRRVGSVSAKTKYIRKLAADHPTLSTKELHKLAKVKLGPMDIGTFRNHVGAARRK